MFLENVKQAAGQVAVLYVMVAVGFICDRIGLFTEKTARKLVDLLMYFIVVCMLVKSFIGIELSQETLKKFFLSMLLGFAVHFIAIVLNIPFFRKKSDERPVFKYACIYGNVGFMALPLAQAVLGDEGVFYCANGVIAFNVITFIHGAALMSREKQRLNFKKLILNPGVISVMIGLPLFLLQIKLPAVILEPLEYFSAINTPLAMLIFGTYLSCTGLRSVFSDKRIYLVALFKLVLMPLACIGVFRLCGVTGTLLTAFAITACVPSANNTFMFATKYNRDTGLASRTVALVSLFSVITMPVIIAFSQSI